ncbi:MAG: hypothetical protein M1838_002128 [Thelocarpon superellum]|nr:MAG: hypothetical protein M1838_002128 [Thelocarpon superellum]
MTRTALVTGATGFLGREVVKTLQIAGWHVTGTGFTRAKPPAILKVDLESKSELVKVLEEVKPDVVIHCAANRFPDKCDTDPQGTLALNVQASRTLAEVTTERSILLIYISTDYVFPGVPGEAPYEVESSTRPTTFYGQSKLSGEEAVLRVTEHRRTSVVLRIPVLYGAATSPAESAVNVLMDTVWKAQEVDVSAPEQPKEGQPKVLTVDDWSIRYPTNTEDVARVLRDVASKYLDTPGRDRDGLPRILQFSSEHRVTKYRICQIFAEILGLPLDEKRLVPNAQGNDPHAAVQRPYDCHLSTRELKSLGIDVRTVDFTAWW